MAKNEAISILTQNGFVNHKGPQHRNVFHKNGIMVILGASEWIFSGQSSEPISGDYSLNGFGELKSRILNPFNDVEFASNHGCSQCGKSTHHLGQSFSHCAHHLELENEESKIAFNDARNGR